MLTIRCGLDDLELCREIRSSSQRLCTIAVGVLVSVIHKLHVLCRKLIDTFWATVGIESAARYHHN